MEPTTLFTLLNDVVKYYSIGQHVSIVDYPGYKNWEAIIRKKFEFIQSDNHYPWLDIVEAFEQKKLFEDDVIDCSYFQFPSLTIRLILDRSSFIDGLRERTFVLDISLLCQFYSAFIEDRFYVGPTQILGQNVPGKKYTLINLSTQHPDYQELESIAKMKIPVLFDGYQHIDHYRLFQHTIDNIQLYNVVPGELKSRTLYNILFSGYYQNFESSSYKVSP